MNLIKGVASDSNLVVKTIFLFCIIAFSFILTLPLMTVAGILLGMSSTPFLYVSQAIVTVFLFVLPVFICSYIFYPKQADTFRSFVKKTRVEYFLMAIVFVTVAIPFINWLYIWNQSLSLPDCMKSIEDWMRASEDAAQRTTERLLQVDSYALVMCNVLMIALVPAFCEELFFRAFLQNLLSEYVSRHLAVCISAFIFSFVHFQFYGFFPRFLMGIVFGYMYFATGSLWVSVLAHFLNNAMVVVVTVLSYWHIVTVDLDTCLVHPFILPILSFASICAITYFYWSHRKSNI